ncbi:hypothetical protein RvVAT039_pl05870 (plasmid) [Agrobacterium vitis]|nr:MULTISPECIES: EAL domain-containing protein [Rhizobium/Agrobacterium group]NSX98829.1 EAL domain-containing protein [Agrobacterium vitis]NSZ29968.1 EAL domain-containing protein [Agrobacterium vitis]NSZ45420.1 EAL domain-containing protein [Agrobacterium vitis]NTA29200.1 EAL domain-containing protein [Allorhizobium ampelinum]NTA34491.1 EAL domain-containing protein [Agrobacterium vitis]
MDTGRGLPGERLGEFAGRHLQDRREPVSDSIPGKVLDALRRHGVKPASIELEITEEVALGDHERSMRTLLQLRDLGVGVAFDDFGTGYASLSSLQRFPLTTLKIDRAFIRNIDTNPSERQSPEH